MDTTVDFERRFFARLFFFLLVRFKDLVQFLGESTVILFQIFESLLKISFAGTFVVPS